MKKQKIKAQTLINDLKIKTSDVIAETSKYFNPSDVWDALSAVSPSHLTGFICLMALVLLNMDSLQAVQLAKLREPMQHMKKEMWSYIYPVQVSSVVVGAAFSLMKQSVMPFGIGAGITVASNFLEKIIGDGSAALI